MYWSIVWSQLKNHKKPLKITHSALEEFSAVVNFDGGDLEETYKKLTKNYEKAKHTLMMSIIETIK